MSLVLVEGTSHAILLSPLSEGPQSYAVAGNRVTVPGELYRLALLFHLPGEHFCSSAQSLQNDNVFAQ